MSGFEIRNYSESPIYSEGARLALSSCSDSGLIAPYGDKAAGHAVAGQ